MATKAKPVVLGCTARELVTGYKGIVHCRAELLNGNVQFTLQAKPEKKSPNDVPKPRGFDEHTVVYVDAGVSATVPKPVDHAVLTLGVQAKDRVSGLSGIVVDRVTFMNGCVYYGIQPPAITSGEKAGEMPQSVLFASDRVEQTGKGVTEKIATAAAKPTGGLVIEDRRVA